MGLLKNRKFLLPLDIFKKEINKKQEFDVTKVDDLPDVWEPLCSLHRDVHAVHVLHVHLPQRL